MRNFLRNYALGLLLFTLFVLSLIGQWLTHDGTAKEFLNAVFENEQSEFLQLLCAVVFPIWLIFRNSPQSRDGNDRMQADLLEIKMTQQDILQRIRGKTD